MSGEIAIDFGCFTEVWAAISELANQITHPIKQIISAAWNGIVHYIDAICQKISQGFNFLYKGICWVVNRLLRPLFYSAVNVNGFFLDKFLLGSPGLRPYLTGGLLESHAPQRWRNWVANNVGWDIYATMGEATDNVVGILGVGVGVLNIFSHFVTSIYRNIYNFYNFLGDRGILGSSKPYQDNRHLVVRVVFGSLTAPIVAPIVLITNTLDVIGTGVYHFAKNTWLSLYRNLRSSAHLLGKKGLFGERPPYADDRHLAIKVIFGALTLPVVAPIALITNTLDVIGTGIYYFAKNTWLSLYRNLRSSAHLLGKKGLFGEHSPYADDRHLAIKVIFGALTLPVVAPIALITNTLDIIGTGIYHFAKNTWLSLYRNLRSSVHLLGKKGLFGERHPYADDRHLAIKVIFGALTLPIVVPLAVLGNVLDGVGTVFYQGIKNITLSFYRNLKATYNLWGKYGIFGERKPYSDDRHIATRLIFGALTLPLVAPVAIMSNLANGVAAYFKNWRHTIFTPLVFATAVPTMAVLALPVFLTRHFVKGLYNCTVRPILDASHGREINVSKAVQGGLNTVTLGGFAVVKHVFKACTGYSTRFGFPSNVKRVAIHNEDEEHTDEVQDNFAQAQAQFKAALDYIMRGKPLPVSNDEVPHVDKLGSFRPFLRIFFGIRQKAEIILKNIHNDYLAYAKAEERNRKESTSSAFSLVTFFQSNQARRTENAIKAEDKEAFNAVRHYLCPSA